MTTRRAFITGLLASAATGAAQACPAQPATVFPWTEVAVPLPWGAGVWGETPWAAAGLAVPPGGSMRVVHWTRVSVAQLLARAPVKAAP